MLDDSTLLSSIALPRHSAFDAEIDEPEMPLISPD